MQAQKQFFNSGGSCFVQKLCRIFSISLIQVDLTLWMVEIEKNIKFVVIQMDLTLAGGDQK